MRPEAELASVCLLGGSGFVGRSTAEHLSREGRRVRILTRHGLKARVLKMLPTAEIVSADPHDDTVLARQFEGMDAVVNLVAILHPRRGATFQAVHVDFARKVAGACRAAGVRRLIHMSALGADESGPSEYQRSKGRGEGAVREAAGTMALTILRPSVIFGAGDAFLNLFATLARYSPVMPLAMADARLQPIWVEDVARVIARCLDDSRTVGQRYELAGPKAYTLAQIVAYVGEVTGRRRPIVPLPDWAATLQAAVFEHVPTALLQPFFSVRLPGPLLTRDNLRSLSVDNVCATPFPEIFGFQPAPLEAIAPGYLGAAGLKGRYGSYRYRAGR